MKYWINDQDYDLLISNHKNSVFGATFLFRSLVTQQVGSLHSEGGHHLPHLTIQLADPTRTWRSDGILWVTQLHLLASVVPSNSDFLRPGDVLIHTASLIGRPGVIRLRKAISHQLHLSVQVPGSNSRSWVTSGPQSLPESISKPLTFLLPTCTPLRLVRISSRPFLTTFCLGTQELTSSLSSRPLPQLPRV